MKGKKVYKNGGRGRTEEKAAVLKGRGRGRTEELGFWITMKGTLYCKGQGEIEKEKSEVEREA